jgi:signal transduction histidine kinase
LAYLVATYSVGAHAATRRAVIGLLVSTVPAAALAIVRLRAGADASEIIQPVMVLIAAWVAGRISARRHHRAELVEHRAAQVESGATDIAREAAERERTRIARELQ